MLVALIYLKQAKKTTGLNQQMDAVP